MRPTSTLTANITSPGGRRHAVGHPPPLAVAGNDTISKVRKRPFGSDPSRPSKEDAEREAAEELARLTRGARPPDLLRQEQRPAFTAPSQPPAFGPPSAFPSPGGPSGGYEPVGSAYPQPPRGGLSREEEEEAITELAIQDLAERAGRGLEAFVIERVDPAAVEATRDRALQEILERQARIQRQARQRNPGRAPTGGSPLERAASSYSSSVSPLGADAPLVRATKARVRLGSETPPAPTPEPSEPVVLFSKRVPPMTRRVAVRKQAVGGAKAAVTPGRGRSAPAEGAASAKTTSGKDVQDAAPTTGKLTTRKPTTGKPTTRKPTTGKPTTAKPAAKKPAAKRSK